MIAALALLAAQPGAANLVIATEHGVAMSDYPSAAKCEAARAEAIRIRDTEIAKARAEAAAKGGTLIDSSFALVAFCLPK